MNYWIISPNASADSENQEIWKELIQSHHVAFMGWGTDHPLGETFTNEIKKGDVILIAQGANRNKRLFLSGIVSSDALYESIEGMPADASYRKLEHVIEREQLERLGLDFNGCAYGDADRIPAIYKLKPWQTPQDKIVSDILYNKIIEIMQQEDLNKSISLLKLKKQIILQGPPGTGKTRLAKQIANELSRPNSITLHDIDKLIRPGITFNSATDYTQYSVDSIGDAAIQVKLKTGSIYPASKSKIVNAYSNKLWQGGQKNGSDPYEAAIAKFIFENIGNEQYKLIQFHPAYSYEDFVRGITAKANGNSVEYKTENKTLAEFAEKALKNWNDSNKSVETISFENWINNELTLFAEKVQDDIVTNGSYPLNDSVSVFRVEFKEGSDAFRYTGKNKATGEPWDVSNEQRMKFRDVALAYVANAQSRQDIKVIPGISGRAREHASYDFLMLTKFREYLQTRPAYIAGTSQNSLKNFVLIIDEINRANLPAVMGELIYALEYRGESVESMYDVDGDRNIILPPNLYIIGTMNTADRSVGHIDYAIRRRFAFVEVPPSDTVIDEVIYKDAKLNKKAKDLYAAVAALFTTDYLAPDFKAKDVQLGHSYFLAEAEDQLKLKLEYEIRPLLNEYLKDGIFKDEKVIDKINALNV